MTRHALSVLFAALTMIALLHAPVSVAVGQRPGAESTTRTTRDVEVPEKAREVLAEIQKRNGEPPPGYLGGRVFGNRERRLPRGDYRLEWLPAKGYLIAVIDADVLLADDPGDYNTFIEVAKAVAKEWATPRRGPAARPAVPFHVCLLVDRDCARARKDWSVPRLPIERNRG